MYLTYEEYQNMGGELDASSFSPLEYESEVKVDYYTFNRLKADTQYSDRVKACVFKIIEYLNVYEDYYKTVTNINSPVIASQSNDGVSISYGGLMGNTSPSDVKEIAKKTENDIYKAIKQYLYGEKNEAGEVLLYRGVYR